MASFSVHYGKVFEEADADEMINTYDSFLVLMSPDEEQQLPPEFLTCCEGSQKVIENIPFVTGEVADQDVSNMMTTLDSFTSENCLVICKTACRASCVKAIHEGLSKGWSAEETLKWAEENELPFVNFPTLRNIVFSQIKRRELQGSNLIFRQLFECTSCTYSYILACPETREGVIIDPVVDTYERDAQTIREMGITLKYGINTHCHADHVTGTAQLKGEFPDMQSVIADEAGAKADWLVNEGDLIHFGNRSLSCKSTPGHTSGCMTFVLDDQSMCFTGDTLLIRGCGRIYVALS